MFLLDPHVVAPPWDCYLLILLPREIMVYSTGVGIFIFQCLLNPSIKSTVRYFISTELVFKKPWLT
jgi:hypothetical protein